MAQKIAQELLKSSSHRLGTASHFMPALNSEQSNIVRAAQQKAAEIAVQANPLSLYVSVCVSVCACSAFWYATLCLSVCLCVCVCVCVRARMHFSLVPPRRFLASAACSAEAICLLRGHATPRYRFGSQHQQQQATGADVMLPNSSLSCWSQHHHSLPELANLSRLALLPVCLWQLTHNPLGPIKSSQCLPGSKCMINLWCHSLLCHQSICCVKQQQSVVT